MALKSSPTLRLSVFGGMALTLSGALALAFWPMVRADRAVQAFCAGQAAGTPAAQVEAQAAERGYTAAASGPSLLIDDPAGFGRRQCTLALDAQGRVAAQR